MNEDDLLGLMFIPRDIPLDFNFLTPRGQVRLLNELLIQKLEKSTLLFGDVEGGEWGRNRYSINGDPFPHEARLVCITRTGREQ